MYGIAYKYLFYSFFTCFLKHVVRLNLRIKEITFGIVLALLVVIIVMGHFTLEAPATVLMTLFFILFFFQFLLPG